MELYVLDATLQRVEVIDRFKSLIWTDRYNKLGDFKLEITASRSVKELLSEGTLLACNSSYRVMVIENIEDSSASDGTDFLTISGRSLELVLTNRVVLAQEMTGTPGDICRALFESICVNGVLSASDILPFYVAGSLFPSDTNFEYPDEVTIPIVTESLFKVLTGICDTYDMGFRLVRDPYTGSLYFDIYVGLNRTTKQSDVDAVVFSQNLDTLTNTKELVTIENQKNCAYVYTETTSKYVYSEGSTEATGFDRKLLPVDATDYTPTGDVDVDNAVLEARGLAALAEYRGLQNFDGEINQRSDYLYDVNYSVGDMVEMRSRSGFSNYLRVTEQILTSDSSGEAAYPTLTKSLAVLPGSWASWAPDQYWSDLDGDNTVWVEAP